jgi:hypothetical protein
MTCNEHPGLRDGACPGCRRDRAFPNGSARCWRGECRTACYYPDACSETAAEMVALVAEAESRAFAEHALGICHLSEWSCSHCEPCVAPPGKLCTETGCWDADRCVVRAGG